MGNAWKKRDAQYNDRQLGISNEDQEDVPKGSFKAGGGGYWFSGLHAHNQDLNRLKERGMHNRVMRKQSSAHTKTDRNV